MSVVLYAKLTLLILSSMISNVLVAHSSEIEDIVETTFREAVVKIDVSTNIPIFKDGLNICTSEGTGFLIGSTYVITAEHVFRVPSECGNPIIIIKSRKHKLEQLARVVGFKDDIAVLDVGQPFPSSMCILRMMAADVFDSKGFRYGIPGHFLDPSSVPVKVGPKDNEFSPLIVLTPTAAEAGESGGPIIYKFNVVGVLRAKHNKYTAYSFMISGSRVLALTKELNLKTEGRVCNPVEVNMYNPSLKTVQATIKPSTSLSYESQSLIDQEIENIFKSTQYQFGSVDNTSVKRGYSGLIVSRENNVVTNGAVRNETVIRLPFGGSITLDVPSSGPSTFSAIAPYLENDIEHMQNKIVVEQTAAAITRNLEEVLWNRYLQDGEQKKRWEP